MDGSTKFGGMADAFTELQARDDAADLSHAEWLGLLIDSEASNRSTKKLQSRMRADKRRRADQMTRCLNAFRLEPGHKRAMLPPVIQL